MCSCYRFLCSVRYRDGDGSGCARKLKNGFISCLLANISCESAPSAYREERLMGERERDCNSPYFGRGTANLSPPRLVQQLPSQRPACSSSNCRSRGRRLQHRRRWTTVFCSNNSGRRSDSHRPALVAAAGGQLSTLWRSSLMVDSTV